MDSDTVSMPSPTPRSNNETRDGAMVFTTITSLGEDLANLRLEVPPMPFNNVSCSPAGGENSKVSTAALAENAFGLKPPSNHLCNAESVKPIDLTDEEAIDLLGFASTSSMRSLMTDSLFSVRSTTDSCPPSPSSSAHIAGPLPRKSFDLIPRPIFNPSRPIHISSTLRNGGQKTSRSPIFYLASSNSSEDGSSHPASEYGSKESTTFSSRSSVHEFSGFTDEDGEQGRGLRDDLYDLLVEDICNVISNRLTETDLRKLNAPIAHYAHVLVERVTHDLGDTNMLSTTPVIYQTFGSSEGGSTSSTPKTPNLHGTFGHESKHGLPCDHNDFDQDDSDDADSGLPMELDEHQNPRRASAKEDAMSCPYRKRVRIRV